MKESEYFRYFGLYFKFFQIFSFVFSWIILGTLPSEAAEISRTITLRANSPDLMSVDFNSETGALEAIRFQGENWTVDGDSFMPFDLNQGEKDTRNEQWIAWNNTEFLGLEQPTSTSVVLKYRAGSWETRLTWFWDEKREMLGRKMKVRWTGEKEVKIRSFWWRFPTFESDSSAYFFTPGQFPPKKTLISEMTGKNGAWERPGIVQLSPKRTAVFFVDYHDPQMDQGGTEIERKGERGVQATQVFQIFSRMKPGDEQDLGTTYLWLLPMDAESVLLRLHEGYERLGFVVPKDRPKEFQNLLLYSFHPGGSIGSNMQDLGGFRKAVPFVDRMAETGANSVWMLPLEDRGIYWPRDYYRFQEGLGTGDEYRALVHRLHERGFYVMQDCVPHGGSNEFERAKLHPEWLVYDEDGSTFHYWCFDFNWPTWREYMKQVAKHYMKNYGVDGYRIDAVSGSKIPNWNPDIPYARASFSKLQAGFNMQRSIREGVKEESAVRGGTLAEVGADYFGIVSDAIYDFSGCYHVFQAARAQAPKQYVSDLRRWLFECRYGSLKGLLRLRHSESHDSLRSQYWYGTEGARAIVALTALIDGIPLIYQWQEVGNIGTYAKLFAIRNSLPEMQNANFDYLGIPAPDGVFAVGYEKDGKRSIGLINFNDTPVSFSLPLSTETDFVTEMVSGKVIPVEEKNLPVSLEPFAFGVYALREVTFAPPEILASESSVKPETLPETGCVLSGSDWEAFIDSTTGLLTSFTRNGKQLLGSMFFSQKTDVPAVRVKSEGQTLVFDKPFGQSVCRLTYQVKNDRLLISAEWLEKGVPQAGSQESDSRIDSAVSRDLTIYFQCPKAGIWSANTAEGFLRDRIIWKNEEAVDVNSRHGIYWRPMELDVLYDSFYQPLWREAQIGAEWSDASVSFSMFEDQLPARVRWLNQHRGDKVLTAAFSLQGPLDARIPGKWSIAVSPEKTEKKVFEKKNASYVLRPTMGGWYFENAFYVLKLTRSGTIQGFISKKSGKELFSNGNLYSDYGFGPRSERFSNANEVEVWSRLETLENGSVRLHFEGRLRKKDRFGRMPQPVSFVTEFTLDNSETMSIRSKISAPAAKDVNEAFLAWMLSGKTIDEFEYRKAGRTIVNGRPLEVEHRSWQVRGNVTPDEMILKSEGKEVLAVHGFGRDPFLNIFFDRSNFFFCFFDGKMPQEKKTMIDSEWKFSIR